MTSGSFATGKGIECLRVRCIGADFAVNATAFVIGKLIDVASMLCRFCRRRRLLLGLVPGPPCRGEIEDAKANKFFSDCSALPTQAVTDALCKS
jgi:hypothetical protein